MKHFAKLKKKSILGWMVMGMREKLIELLKEAMVLSDGICRIAGNTQVVAIGHYLFANGVTIPVRCKQCVHYEFGVCLKIYSDGAVSKYAWQARKKDDFCSYGERRTDDERTG
jgi:hypothetical protein